MERIAKINGNRKMSMFFTIQQENFSVLNYPEVKDKQKELRRLWNKIGIAKAGHGAHFSKWKNKIKF